ncbi:MAG TPA: glycine zipper 2TM domain-containing protein [Gemmatimonadaceae bacterium]|nr:glycine zipper 2TM domain-containing protein [Gemmatimonadaceae bacterium]
MTAHRRPFCFALSLATAVVLMAGCRDRTPAPSVDSALAQDLAMAQREGPGPAVFNDAPIGAAAPAARAPARPAPRPEPPRASAPRPRPTPRRDSPPAQVAQRPREPAQRAEDPGPAPAPAPAPSTAGAGVIGAGSRIGMSINGRVCTNTALAGDKFTATVTTPTMGSNGVMIPAGATVVLEVASVDRADPAENSRIEFRVRAIDVNGSARQVDGDVATLASLETAQSSGGNERTKVLGGAVAGAVLGQIFGRSTKSTVIGAAAGAAAGTAAARTSRTTYACLPEGSALRLTLSRDLVVRRGDI